MHYLNFLLKLYLSLQLSISVKFQNEHEKLGQHIEGGSTNRWPIIFADEVVDCGSRIHFVHTFLILVE